MHAAITVARPTMPMRASFASGFGTVWTERLSYLTLLLAIQPPLTASELIKKALSCVIAVCASQYPLPCQRSLTISASTLKLPPAWMQGGHTRSRVSTTRSPLCHRTRIARYSTSVSAPVDNGTDSCHGHRHLQDLAPFTPLVSRPGWHSDRLISRE